jgi:hypothetical protein
MAQRRTDTLLFRKALAVVAPWLLGWAAIGYMNHRAIQPFDQRAGYREAMQGCADDRFEVSRNGALFSRPIGRLEMIDCTDHVRARYLDAETAEQRGVAVTTLAWALLPRSFCSCSLPSPRSCAAFCRADRTFVEEYLRFVERPTVRKRDQLRAPARFGSSLAGTVRLGFTMTVSARPNRRQFAALAAAFGATLAFGPGKASAAPWREHRAAFPQGVASGDPDPHSVVLWTRREPEAGVSAYRLAVEVAADPAFRRIVARGTARVDATTDWTCRFLAAGLSPSSEYYYRFTDQTGAGSRVGRTLTAPAEDDDRPFRFAFVSCQDVTQGYCNAYKRMIFEDERAAPADRLAFVLHLGDFIYEVTWYPEDSPNGMKGTRRLQGNLRYPTGEKLHDYHVPADLADYRVAYKSYLLDPDLQDARARFPFVSVWDNHEFSWQGFQSQQVWDGQVRPEQTRKIAANQAWFEFQPARVRQMDGGVHFDHFRAPTVQNAAIEHYDGLGTGMEPNNLAAIRSLQIYRTLKWGRNADHGAEQPGRDPLPANLPDPEMGPQRRPDHHRQS